jgi:hypothetical protein
MYRSSLLLTVALIVTTVIASIQPVTALSQSQELDVSDNFSRAFHKYENGDYNQAIKINPEYSSA